MGLALVPDRRRHRAPEFAFSSLREEDIENRVLLFDSHTAQQAAALAAKRQRAGQQINIRDTQIAGIAQACRATLAVRNFRYFEGLTISGLNLRATLRDAEGTFRRHHAQIEGSVCAARSALRLEALMR